MPLFSDLLKQAATLSEGGVVNDDVVNEFTAAFKKLTPAEKADIAKQAKDAIKANPALEANYKKSTFNSVAFAFQTVVHAIEMDDDKPANTFPNFSKFHANDPSHHPDGKYGPLTRAVYLGTEGAAKGKKNALDTWADQATGKSAQSGVDAPVKDDKTTTAPVKTKEQLELEEQQRLQKQKEEEEAKKPKSVNATAEDIAKYTFKRSQVQYFEDVIKENPAAKGLTVVQLKGISDAVKEYAFDKDGKLKEKSDDGRKMDYTNSTVIAQLRAAVREKTHDLGVTDAQIEKLTFSVGQTQTRSIVGSFTAAENAMVNADKVLTKSAENIKAHFSKPENKEFLEKAGVKTEDFADLENVREDKRGVYFKTNFVPPLQKLAEKEAVEIRAEYAQKIADEKAKLLKFDVLDKVVNIAYPKLVEVQQRDDKGELVFKDTKKVDYAADGKEIVTMVKVPVMDPIKKPDEKALFPLEPNLNDRATKEALLAAGLINDKGEFAQLTHTTKKDGKEVTETVSADVALRDPKTYNDAIKAKLDETYAFTDDEKKKNTFGGAKLDKNIINGKIAVQKDVETKAVAKEVVRLEGEREVKIENSPSNVMLKDAFDVNDSKRIANGQSATSALGKYEEANKFYNLAASYETERQLDELTGKGVSKGFLNIGSSEYKDLQKKGDAIEVVLAKRVASAKEEVKKLDDAVKAEKDETKKAALSTKLEAANAGLKALTENPKNFDQKDQVQMINVNMGSVDLIHVDAKTHKEQKQAQADLKKQQEELENAKHEEEKKNAPKKEEKKTTSTAAPTKTEANVTAKDEGKGTDIKAQIVALDGNVQALIDKISADINGLETPALAVDNKFAGNQKQAKKDWNKAVDALDKDLKELKKLNGQDAAEGTDFDKALAGTLAKAKDLGVVVTDKFEVDSKQTLQNLKAKNATGIN